MPRDAQHTCKQTENILLKFNMWYYTHFNDHTFVQIINLLKFKLFAQISRWISTLQHLKNMQLPGERCTCLEKYVVS